jgi:hypothetical protein
VFAPPVATLTNAKHATEADLAQGLVISVELDERPTQALQALVTTLGIPTVIMASGGTWTDPVTGEVQDKLHVHYRLREPTREPAAHAKLKHARRLAVRLVGADPTTITTVHPLRWAGSWHLKDPKNLKLARVGGGDPEAEIDLDEALRLLTEACSLAGLDPDPAAAGGSRQEHRDTGELIQRITGGTEYLAPLVALSARYAGAGMSKRQIVETLRGFLEAVPDTVRDLKDGKRVKGRWQDRWNGVERMADTAVAKFGPQGEATVEHGAEVAEKIIASAEAKTGGRAEASATETGDALSDTSHDGLALDMGRKWTDTRHVALWGQWLFYTGSRWERDERLHHMTRTRDFLRRKADELVRWAHREVAKGAAGEKLVDQCEAMAKTLRSAQTVANVVGLARSNPGQATTVEQRDADPFKLGVPEPRRSKP